MVLFLFSLLFFLIMRGEQRTSALAVEQISLAASEHTKDPRVGDKVVSIPIKANIQDECSPYRMSSMEDRAWIVFALFS